MTRVALIYRNLSVTLAVLWLAGCSFAPDYAPPDIATPDTFKEAVGNWQDAQPADNMQRGEWWHVFHDAQLDALENDVTTANQTLKVALAQYDQARLQASAARTAYFPNITGGVGAARTQDSLKLANTSSVALFNSFAAQGDFSYELDLWGRVRNTVTANQDQAEASAADLENVKLSLHAEMAINYIALRADDEIQKILDHIVQNDQRALDITQKRYKGGVSPESDVDLAQTRLETAKAAADDIRLQRAQLEHAIAVLAGKPPAMFSLPAETLRLHLPRPAPGLPSQLLQRRPDIAAAERRVAAANAEIGVARAAFFPTFSLTGSAGYESAKTGSWFTAPASFWSLGPSAVVTLFDAGRLSDLSDEARAAYEQTAAQYRQTVLSAYQEVEDNLAALHHLRDESLAQSAALHATDRALAHASHLFKGGTTTYLDLVVAQNNQLEERMASVALLARRMTASVQLIKAAGGSFDNKTGATP